MQDQTPKDISGEEGFFSEYIPPPGHFDELKSPKENPEKTPVKFDEKAPVKIPVNIAAKTEENRLRFGYGKLFAPSGSELKKDLAQRWKEAKQSLRDNPPSSTGQLIKSGTPQAWQLDPIPIVISSQDWDSLASGIKQRMRLIDLLLKDVYGPQNLIASGDLPASLVYHAPSYLRAARRQTPDPQPMLTLYAVQAYRSPSGEWRVLADRTQGPSGCGHAVENRLAMSRIHADSFQSMQVNRIAGFFASLRNGMQEASTKSSPGREKGLRAAILSPGIQSPTYFEDAYLARYLGYTLIQTADLTVRGGFVYVKTLGGLIRVESILRRLADTSCDPLEINPSSNEGVPGLAMAARLGKVLLANPLGTGWAESPAVSACLPKLCNLLLGEDLQLTNSPMWWCGDPESLDHVLSHLDTLWIRDAFVRHSANQIDGNMLSNAAREQLATRIREQPWAFVAMDPPQLSYVPTWGDDRLVAWPAMFRFFGCSERERFHVMPGGVARVAPSPRDLDESLASGTMSKDVWVLSDGPVKPITLLGGNKQSIELKRSAMDLPSREIGRAHV